jgi:lipopolysaccharide heptosyltransferase II
MDALRKIERPFKRTLSGAFRLIAGSSPLKVDPSTRFHKILVVRQHNQLGDMLCVLPLLRQLKATYPGVWISLVASPVNAGVMTNNRYLDDVILYDKSRYLKEGRLRLFGFWRFVKELRSRRYDLAVVPGTVSTSFTSDLLAYLSGAPVRVGVRSLEGRENPAGFLFNVARDLDWSGDPRRHQTLRNADIMGRMIPPPQDLHCELSLTSEELERGREWISARTGGTGKRVAFHPGAGKPPNRWPVEKFAALGKELKNSRGAQIFVTEGPMDHEVVESLDSALSDPVEHIAGKGIRDVASILSSMDLVVSNDTGVMHVAAAVGVPVVSLFGPTDPYQWAPVTPGNRWIRSVGGDISEISVGAVLAACEDLLGRTRA